MPASLMGPWGKKVAVERGAERGQSVSRLNVLIAITAAIIGLIYGYDLGSIASALLFLVPAFDLSTFMTSVVTSAVVLGQLFGIFLALALVSFSFVYILAPATKGRPLEEIRSYWYNGGSWPEESHT
jgi:hypothetical protein